MERQVEPWDSGLDLDDNEFRPLEADLDEYHPKATRTLFIGNLEKDVTSAELRQHFECFGPIIEIDIKKQSQSGANSNAYAFCQYADIASVVRAMRHLDGEQVGNTRVKLGFGKSMPTNCVWLHGVAETVAEKFLARHMGRFGHVSYAAIDRDRCNGLVFYDQVGTPPPPPPPPPGVVTRTATLKPITATVVFRISNHLRVWLPVGSLDPRG